MNCVQEPNVLRAAEEDRWNDALRAHILECEDCQAAAAIAPWMDRFARISDREHILPDPSVVWLKAQLLRGTMDAARAARPMTFAQLIAYLIVGTGWAALLTWKWQAVSAWLRHLTPAGMMTGSSSELSFSFFALVFVLASSTVMIALHTILAEE